MLVKNIKKRKTDKPYKLSERYKMETIRIKTIEESAKEFLEAHNAKRAERAVAIYESNLSDIKGLFLADSELLISVLIQCLRFTDPVTKEILSIDYNDPKSYKRWLAFIIGLDDMSRNKFKLKGMQHYLFPKNREDYDENKDYIMHDQAQSNIKHMVQIDAETVVDYFTGFITKYTTKVLNLLRLSREKMGINLAVQQFYK